jgi:hypothetical protein
MQTNFTKTVPTKTILFVDPRVDNYQSLIENVAEGTGVFVLDLDRDGVEQIAEILGDYQGLESIQILSHGAAGMVQLGGANLSLENLASYQQQLQQWGKALSETGDILLYGCNVAANGGHSFVSALSEMTGADVAASVDVTGNAALGGNWQLEVQTGEISAASALDEQRKAAYQGALAVYKVTNTNDSGSGSLRDAIWYTNYYGGNNVIDLSAVAGQTIFLNSPLGNINYNTFFDGNETNRTVIDGRDAYQIITVTNGARVSFSGVNFYNGYARGGDGSYGGGGGGLGAGGAIFVNSGTVSIDNAYFFSNLAQGGSGGPSDRSGGSLYSGGYSGGYGGGLNGGYVSNYGVGGSYQSNGGSGGSGGFGQGGGGGAGGGGGGNSPAGSGGSGGSGGFGGGGGGGGGGGSSTVYVGRPGSGGTGGAYAGSGSDGQYGYVNNNQSVSGSGGAGAGLGGAIFLRNNSASSSLSINNSTFGSNWASTSGAAIFTESGQSYGDTTTSLNANGPTLGVTFTSASEANGAVFTVNALSGTIPAGGIDVYYVLRSTNPLGGNYAAAAAEGTDYTVVHQSRITAADPTIKITIANDTVFDPNEQFSIELLPSNDYLRSSTNRSSYIATATIEDNPLIGVRTLQNGFESDSVSGHGLFELVFDKDAIQDFTLKFNLPAVGAVDGTNTAKRGSIANPDPTSDYRLYWRYNTDPDSTRNYFLANGTDANEILVKKGTGTGNKKIYVGVEVFNNEIFELPKQFNLGLVASTGYGINAGGQPSSAVMKIADNEPVISISKVVNPTEGFGYGSTLIGLGSALQLEKSKRVEIAASPSLDLSQNNQFTVEFWTAINKLDSTANGYRLIGFDNDSVNISVNNSGKIIASIQDKNLGAIVLESLDRVTIDTWTHIATSFDGESLSLFVNGRQVAFDQGGDRQLNKGDKLSIGSALNPNTGFVGMVDEVRMWNIARTQEQIQQNLLTNFKGNEQGLVGYWQLNGDVKDATINQNNGTLNSLQGLNASYYNYTSTPSFSGTPALTRIDPNINLNTMDSPGAGVNIDKFNTRWTGFIKAPKSGIYTFKTFADDGVRLMVNNQVIINRWVDGGGSTADVSSLNVAMEEGKLYPISLDYYENAGNARMQLVWSAIDNSGSSILAEETIGTQNLLASVDFVENPSPQLGYIELQSTDINGTPLPIAQGNGLWVRYNITTPNGIGNATRLPLPNPDGSITPTTFDYYNSQFQVSTTAVGTRFDGVVIPKGETTARIYFGAVADAIEEGNERISVQLIPYNIENNPTSPDSAANKNKDLSKYALRDSNGVIVAAINQDVFIQDSTRYQAGFFILGANNRLIGNYRSGSTLANGTYLSFDNIQPDKDRKATIFIRPSSQPANTVTLNIGGKTFTWNATNWETAQAVTLSNLTGNSSNLGGTSSNIDSNYNGTFNLNLQLGTPREDYLLLAESPLSANQKAVIPQVSLLVNDRLVEDRGDFPANVIIRLSDPAPVGGLKLYFKISGGTATLDTDYTIAGEKVANTSDTFVVTVPEGLTTYNLPITAIDDLVAENRETIEVTLLAQDNTKYVVTPIATQSKVTMSLVDNEDPAIEVKSVTYNDKFRRFETPATNALNGIAANNISFADLDRDDDLDAFGIDAQNQVIFFENTDASAQKNAPQFNQNAAKNPLANIAATQAVFADIDADGKGFIDVGTGDNLRTVFVDGDADVLLVQADGTVIYYQNVDNSELKNNPSFQRNDAANPFNNINIGAGSHLSIVDLDGDRDLDAVVSRADGTIAYYEKTAAATYIPTTPSTNPLKDITVQPGNNLGFADLDRDADVDAYSVKADGTIAYYKNISNAGETPVFVANTEVDTNPFGSHTVAPNSQVQFADINNDRHADVVFTSGTNSSVLVNITTPEPIFTQNLSQIVTEENGTQVNFGVRLSTKPTADVVLTLRGIDATEHSFDKTTLTFTPENWDKYQTITATGVDDSTFDGNINYTLRLSGSGNDNFYKSATAIIMASNADDEQNVSPVSTAPAAQNSNVAQVSINAIGKTTATVEVKAADAYFNGKLALQLGAIGSLQSYTLTKGTLLNFGTTQVEILRDTEINRNSSISTDVLLKTGTDVAKDAISSFAIEQALAPESLNLAVTQAFNGSNNTLGLRIDRVTVPGVTYPSYLLAKGTVLTFGNTKVRVLNDAQISDGAAGTNLTVEFITGDTLSIGTKGEGTPTAQVQVALDRVVEFPIVALSPLDNGAITVKLDRPLGENPESYTLSKGTLLRFGANTEVELLAPANLTNAAPGVTLQVKLNKGTAIAPSTSGSALPWVKVNMEIGNSQTLTGQVLPFTILGSTQPSDTYNRYSFGDLNNDGKLDLVFGMADGKVGFGVNTSTGNNLTFNTNISNPFAGVQTFTIINRIINGQKRQSTVPLTSSAPALTDLDLDGDLDLVLGSSNGTLRLYRNNGTKTAPNFALDNSTNNPFNNATFQFGSRASVVPVFADLNGDGKQDLIVNLGTTGLSYYINQSTLGTDGKVTQSIFTKSPTTSDPFDAVAGINNPLASFADLDGDGDLDMAIKAANTPNTRYFRNIGTSSAPKFQEEVEANNPVISLKGMNSTPSFADLNNDGKADLFLGKVGGSYKYVQNTLDPTSLPGQIKPGETSTTVNFTPANDRKFDGDREVQFLLLEGDNYQVNPRSQSSARTIVMDDDTPAVLITNSQGQLITTANQIQPNLSENGTTQTFSVRLNSQPQGLVTVTLGSNNGREGLIKTGDATGTNPTAETATLRFTPENWNIAQSFSVVAQDDSFDEGDVRFQVVTTIASSLDTNYNGMQLPRLTFTNVDNDAAAVVANGNLGDRANLIEGVTDGFALKLKTQPTKATESVRLVVSPITEQLQLNDKEAGKAVTLTFNGNNWNQEQTIRASAIDDNVVEGTQKTILNLQVERTIGYKDFRDTSELAFQNNAKQGTRLGTQVLRLADTASTDGTAFYNAPSASLLKDEAFETFFRFVSNDPGNTSQGVGLTIANDLAGTKNVKVRFVPSTDNINNQIQIEVNGVVKATRLISAIGSDDQGADTDKRFNNNQAWGAWVSYDGSSDTLEVRLADDLTRPNRPQMSYTGLRNDLGNASAAYLGLFANNGAAVANQANTTQDIIAWTIDGNDPAYSQVEFPNPGANIAPKTFRDANRANVKAPFEVEIQDNDLPSVSIQAGPQSLEGVKPGYFTIALSNVADPTIGNTGMKINYEIVGGTAKNNQDFQQIANTGVIRIAPGEIESNLLVMPIDDFITEGVDFKVTSFDSATKQLGLKVADKVRIYDGSILTFGKAGSNEGMVGRVNLTGVAGVVTDPDTQLKYVEITANTAPAINIERINGTLTLDSTTTTGLQSAPLKIQSAIGSISNPGLVAQYFNGKNNFSGTPVLTRTDSQINFDWGWGSPSAAITTDNFSVRWTGFIQAPTTGTYTFFANGDDGVKLTVNNQAIINDLTDRSYERVSTTIQLQAGQFYPIQMDFYDALEIARARLSWSAVNANNQTIIAKEIIGADKFATTTAVGKNQSVTLELGDFTLIQGSILDLGNGVKATVQDVSKTINNAGGTVNVTLSNDANLTAIVPGAKASLNAENITVKLLPGDGYTLDKSQATLEIADNDAPGVRIAEIGDRTIVQEDRTAEFKVSLLSQPDSPVTVYLNPDRQLTINNTKTPLLQAELTELSTDKTTGTLQLRLFRQPTTDVIIGSATSSEQLIFTANNWNQYQSFGTVNLTADGLSKERNKELLKTTVKNVVDNTSYDLRFEKIGETEVDYYPPVGAKGFYSLTFDATNWYIPQTVELAAIDNGTIDPDLRDGWIKYGIVTGDANYAPIEIPDQSIGIIDRLVDTKVLKVGFDGSLDSFEDSVNEFELPIIGKVGNDDTMERVLDSIQEAVASAVETTPVPTAKALELAIEKYLKEFAAKATIKGAPGVGDVPIFKNPDVSVEVDKNGVTFSINLGQKVTKEFKVPDDFGVGGDLINAKAKGGVEAAFEYDLTLVFGVNKDVGFFINTGDSGIRFAVTGGLSQDFSAEANVGFIQVKATNNAQKPTEIGGEAILQFADPDNVNTFKFFDVNGDGKFNGKPTVVENPIDANKDGKPDIGPDGKVKTAQVSIQEVFTEVTRLGKEKYPLPSLTPSGSTQVPVTYKNIDWNGNNEFDEPSLVQGKGVYRTIAATPAKGATPAKPATYYFDANRNGKLDKGELSTTSDRWVDKTNPNNIKVKEFEIVSQPNITPTAGPASATNAPKLSTVYYFDKNGDRQYTADEQLTTAQAKKYGAGPIKGDSITPGEGKFASGIGIAYRDANNNGQLDLEPFVDTNNNGRWDTGEATQSNAGGTVKPNREVFVTSAYKPIKVDPRGLTTFLDINNDGQDNTVLGNNDRPEPNILNFSDREVQHQFLDWTGNRTFEPIYKKDANGEEELKKDEQNNVVKDANKEDVKLIDATKSFTGDVRILKHEEKDKPQFSYIDLSGDESYSTGGEMLRDENENGTHNSGEFYLDLNNNGQWDGADVVDPIVNSQAASLTFFDLNDDGKHTLLLDKNANGVKDGSEVETDGLILTHEVKNKDKQVVSTFLYLDTSLDGEFNADTEYKVLSSNFGKFIDVNNDKIYNTGDAVIVSREGIVRPITDYLVKRNAPNAIGFLDLNNDGNYNSLPIGPAAPDVLVYSVNGVTSVEINGQTLAGKAIDFLDLNADNRYSAENDLRLGNTQPITKQGTSYWDKDGDGQWDGDESLILKSLTYLDLNDDYRFKSSTAGNELASVLADAYQQLKQVGAKQDSNTIVPEDPDAIEPVVRPDGKGGKYLDLNFNGEQDPGEPFATTWDDSMKIDPKRVLTFDILRDGATKYLDNDGNGVKTQISGEPMRDDQNLDEEINIDGNTTGTLSKLFNIGDLDTSVTFLDVDGDRQLGIKDYPIFIEDGKLYVDLHRNGKLNTIDKRDLNANDRTSMLERGFEVEPFAEASNDFNALVDYVYQAAKNGQPGVYYYDLNRNGQYDKLSDALKTEVSGKLIKYINDGESLTPLEILQAARAKELKTLLTFEAGAAATLGLTLSAGSSDAKWPALSGNLILEIPTPRIKYEDGERKVEATNTKLELKDIKLDLGSAITNIIKPIVSEVDKYISPIKPILNFLNSDLKIPAKLGLAAEFETDGRPGTTLLEIVGKLAAYQALTSSDPKVQKMARGVQTTIKFINFIAQVTEAINTLNELTKDSNSLQLALGSWEKEFTNSPDPEVSVAAQAAKAPPQVSSSSTVTPPSTAPGTPVTAPATTPSKFKKALNTIQAIQGLKFPFLTDFSVPIRLLLGEKGVDLITFAPPNLEFNASVEVSSRVPAFPPLKVGLGGEVNVTANLLFGFDTAGAQEWKESGAEFAEIYKVLDGFYVGDKHNGVDIPEVTASGSIAPFAALDLEVAAFKLEGGVEAKVGLDLVDKGENQGTSDGKLRMSEILSASSFGDLFRISGVVEAFLKASLNIKLLFITKTVWSKELARLKLFEFTIGGGQGFKSGGLVGNAIQSYIQDGTVFWDANLNGILDDNEPFTLTNLDGSYALEVPIDLWDTNANSILDAADGRIAVIGGTDSESGQAFQGQLLALPDSVVISPLTTLKAILVREALANGQTEAEAATAAETQIKAVLGIPEGVDLDTFDPILSLAEKDPNGATVYQAHVQIETLFLNVATLLDSISDKSAGEIATAAATAIAQALNAAPANQVIDLADGDQLKALITNAVTQAAQTIADQPIEPEALAKQVDITIDVAAKGNALNDDLASSLQQAITEGKNLEEVLGGFSANKVIAQTLLPMETRALVTGTQGFYLKDAITAPVTVLEGQSFSFNLAERFQSLDNSAITYQLMGELPAGLSFNGQTGILSGTMSPTTTTSTPILLQFTASNANGTELSGSFTLSPNYKPTDITISNKATAENIDTTSQVLIGSLTVIDPDLDANNVVTLSGDDAAKFTIDTGKLYLKAGEVVDYEAKPSYTLTLTSNDGTFSYVKSLTVDVTNVNEVATKIELTNQSIAENINTTNRVLVGSLNVTDPDAAGNNNVLTLSGTDAARFTIDAGKLYLKAGEAVNYEAKSSYNLTVTATDGSLVYNEALSIAVQDLAEAASDITISNNKIDENIDTTNPVFIGDLAIIDPDAAGNNNVLTLSGTDATRFTIDADKLYLKAGEAVNYEAKSSYNLNLVSTDGSLVYTKPLTVTVGDVNEAPTVLKPLGNITATENSLLNHKFTLPLGTFGDVDNGDSLTYTATLVDANGNTLATPPTWLSLTGTNGNWNLRGTPRAADVGNISIKVTATDTKGLAVSNTFNLVVNPLNITADLNKESKLTGTAGKNILTGGNRNDIISGGGGDDTLKGLDGNDRIDGGDGNDDVRGGNGDDILNGGAGNDIVYGDAGNDRVNGGDGDDTLSGGSGNNTVTGGNGNDTINIKASADTGTSVINGNAGVDTLDFSSSTVGISIDLANTRQQKVINNLVLTVTTIENVTGGSGKDKIAGNSANNLLLGGGDADQFIFGGTKISSISALGIDTLGDFSTTQGDKIQLSKSTFRALSQIGTLAAADFTIVANTASVETAAGKIVYDSSTRTLTYNANGNLAGLGGGGQFANFSGNVALTNSSFEVIN